MSKASETVEALERTDVKVDVQDPEVVEQEEVVEVDGDETEEVEEADDTDDEDVEEVDDEDDEQPAKPTRANSRIRQLNERSRNLEAQLQQALQSQQQLANMILANQSKTTEVADDDDLDPAIKARLQRELAKDRAQMQTALGNVLEEMDEQSAHSNIPGYRSESGNQESKTARIIRQFREDQGRANKYYKRSEAYQYLVATGKLKPVKSEATTVTRKKPKVVTEKKSTQATKRGTTSGTPLSQLSPKDRVKAYEEKYANTAI